MKSGLWWMWYGTPLHLDLISIRMMYTFVCHFLFFWPRHVTGDHTSTQGQTLMLREMMITRQMSRRCPFPLAQQHSRYLWGWPVVHWKPSFQRNEVSYDDYRFIYKAFPFLLKERSLPKWTYWRAGSAAAWMMKLHDNPTCSSFFYNVHHWVMSLAKSDFGSNATVQANPYIQRFIHYALPTRNDYFIILLFHVACVCFRLYWLYYTTIYIRYQLCSLYVYK